MHGHEHAFVLGIVSNLGILFAGRGKQMESEQMYHQVSTQRKTPDESVSICVRALTLLLTHTNNLSLSLSY